MILRSSSHAFASGIVIVSASRSCSSTTSTPRAAQLVHEVGVVALGVLYPHHVVEEQVVGVGRRQPAVGEAGRADKHLAQHADLRVHAVLRVVIGVGGHADSLLDGDPTGDERVDTEYGAERCGLRKGH